MAQPAGEEGRALGLDVGDRRIGIAISDPDGRLAVPVRTIERDRRRSEFDAIARLVDEEEVRRVVVGLPLSMSGELGAQAELTQEFARELEQRLALPVVLWDERLSTQEAERALASRGGGRKRGKALRGDSDALAAAIILQAYLDSLRPRREEP